MGATDLFATLDDQALVRIFASISVSPARELARWDRQRLPHAGQRGVSRGELDLHARRLIHDAARKAALAGAVGGLGGLAMVPQEVLAFLITLTRLAQRLALVYGLDPDSEAGHLAVLRALAAGLEIEAPERGIQAVKLSDLPALVVGQVRDHAADVELGKLVLRRATRMVTSRLIRLVPLLSSAVGAVSMTRQVEVIGERMRGVLGRLGQPVTPGGGIEEAVVLEG
ncbi:MAG: EcsC family protein [Deltaproteobacteria bacterium]|nr:EcsC family protein [Deltaproteobacteria bacterium]